MKRSEAGPTEAAASCCCAHCATELGDAHRRQSGKFYECGRCKSDRVAEPAYYCSEDCARAHWKAEHKKWHELLRKTRERVQDTRPLFQRAVRLGLSEVRGEFCTNPFCWELSSEIKLLHDRRDSCASSGKFREAVALAKKAILLEPANPYLQLHLAITYAETRNLDEAAQSFVRTMELCEETREVYGSEKCENVWAQAFAGLAFMLDFGGDTATGLTIDLPDWVDDDDQFKQMAERAVAAYPGTQVLSARAFAYESQDDPSAADLRHALRDRRRIVKCWPDTEAWSDCRASYEEDVKATEAMLRERIAADVEAARAKMESLKPSGRGRGRGGGRGEKFRGRGRSRSV